MMDQKNAWSSNHCTLNHFFLRVFFFALKTCVGGQDVMMQFMVEMDRNPRTLKKEVLARRGESAFAVLNFFSFLKGRPA